MLNSKEAKELPGFKLYEFSYQNVEHMVYRRGNGPGVILMHEVPGIYSQVIELANCIVDHGYTVFMPRLFGEVGKKPSIAYVVKELGKLCISREFHVLAGNHSSPIADWLRALSREVHAEIRGSGVGVIGLCITGNFALSMMLESFVKAPVLSEPGLPFPLTPCLKSALHVDDETLCVVKQRVKEDGSVLGLRFSNDRSSPEQRFDRLSAELGDGFERIEIDSSPGNPYHNPWWAHSVLTLNLINEQGHPTQQALQRVLSFLEERLSVK